VNKEWFEYVFETLVNIANAIFKKALKNIMNNKKLTPEAKQEKKGEELKTSTKFYNEQFN